MVDDAADLKEQTITRRWIWTVMLLYLIPIPFLLYASLFSVAILNPSGLKIMQLIFIFLCVATPLSIPFSIYFMWRRYFQKKYSEVRFYFALPIITAVICYYSVELMGFLFFRGNQWKISMIKVKTIKKTENCICLILPTPQPLLKNIHTDETDRSCRHNSPLLKIWTILNI